MMKRSKRRARERSCFALKQCSTFDANTLLVRNTYEYTKKIMYADAAQKTSSCKRNRHALQESGVGRAIGTQDARVPSQTRRLQRSTKARASHQLQVISVPLISCLQLMQQSHRVNTVDSSLQ